MRIDQIEYLKKNLQDTVFGLFQRERYANNKEQEKNELRDKVSSIQDALGSIIAVAETFLGMLMEDMKVKNIPVQKISRNAVFVLDEENQIKQILDFKKEQGEKELIPFCIEEFERLNKKLQDYTPSNPELEKLTIQEVVSRLALEMQIQNNISIMALRALMGESSESKKTD